MDEGPTVVIPTEAASWFPAPNDNTWDYVASFSLPPGSWHICTSTVGWGPNGSDEPLSCGNVRTWTAPADPLPAGASYLDTLNYYRSRSGLGSFVDQPENPASPWYTAAGASEGSSSNLSWGESTAREAIEGWLAAPFHAVGILRPGLSSVAFAQLAGGDYGSSAGLDVFSGLGPTPTGQRWPIGFPANGEVVGPDFSGRFGNESPDPLASCAGNPTSSESADTYDFAARIVAGHHRFVTRISGKPIGKLSADEVFDLILRRSAVATGEPDELLAVVRRRGPKWHSGLVVTRALFSKSRNPPVTKFCPHLRR